MRVAITGMGGELGTRVANLLEADRRIAAITGVDIDPPRRRLTRATFARIDPRDRARTAEAIAAFAPTALVHLGAFEPNARSGPRASIERTASGTIAAMQGAVDGDSLDRVIVRSGIEVYGRRRESPPRPTEEDPTDPTTPWGHSLLHVERVALDVGVENSVPVTLLRMAPVVGPHFPSPLGRLLRLPMVPVAVVANPAFSVLHQEDAAAAIVAALHAGYDGPVNLVGAGSLTVAQSARIGGRIPVPVVGPGWRAARAVAELVGAPVPAHIHELLLRGRTADGLQAASRIGFAPKRRTPAVVRDLYAWAEVSYLGVADAVVDDVA